LIDWDHTVLSATDTRTIYMPLLPLAGAHCAYSRRNGQAELTWVACYIPR